MSSPLATQLLEFVRSTFARRSKGQPIEATTPLFSSGLVDSMGMVEFLSFIEQECGVSWDPTVEELTQLDTIERLADALSRKRA